MPQTTFLRRTAVLTWLVLAGCSPDREDAAVQPPAAEAGGTVGGSTVEPAESLTAGEFEIDIGLSGVRVRANRASRGDVLAELARSTDFELANRAEVTGEFTGWFESPTPELAVGHLAPGLEYQASYTPSAAGHRLARIRLGKPSGAGEPAPARSPGTSAGAQGAAVPDQDAQVTELLERWRADNDYAADLLGSPDPGTRVESLEEFDAEGGALVALDRALGSEPDPVVRIALLHKLDESGSVIALQSILRALSDPVPEVVVTAIELAQDWHDEEVVERYLAPLSGHSDAAVREAVEDAIDSMTE